MTCLRTLARFSSLRPLALFAGLLFAGCSSAPATTAGANGVAEFQYSGCLGDDCALTSRGVAAGARATIYVKSKTKVVSAKSSDPTILSIGEVTDGSGGDLVAVNGGKPGSVTLTVYDAASQEIDHVSVQVSATKTIAADESWPSAGPTVLAGETFTVHATTMGAGGERLAGDGAITFGYQGAIERDDSFYICLGDCGQFRAKQAGEGQVLLSAVSATNSLPVHVVAPSAIDALTFASASVETTVGGEPSLGFTMTAAGKTVHGRAIDCASATPAVASLGSLWASTLVEDKSGSLGVHALAKGDATITCTINGHPASFVVHVK
jgi:hypothetical protein